MKLKTTNLNGYNHLKSKRKFNERLMLTFELYKNELPDIWALQEIPVGGKNQICIRQLQSVATQQGYVVILPEKTAWKVSEHPKSIQSVLLLKNARTIEILKLDDRIKLYNRCNHVKAEFDQAEYHILNVHAPQTELFPGHDERDGYVKLRKHLAKQFYVVLKEEISKLVADGKRVILLGDLNMTLDHPELMALGLCDIANTYFCSGNNTADSVDHILVSQNILNEVSSAKCSVDVDFAKVQKLSDHATVNLDIAI